MERMKLADVSAILFFTAETAENTEKQKIFLFSLRALCSLCEFL
jgi:hypothetical protein